MWGSLQWEIEMSQRTSLKKPLKSSWSELYACELLWSQIPDYFWWSYKCQRSAPGRHLCVSPGDCGVAPHKKAESKQWGHATPVLAPWYAPFSSHSQLHQVRKQLWISSPGLCETQDGIPSLLYTENNSWRCPCWGGRICTHLVCDIALCKTTVKRSILGDGWASFHIVSFPVQMPSCLCKMVWKKNQSFDCL